MYCKRLEYIQLTLHTSVAGYVLVDPGSSVEEQLDLILVLTGMSS